MRLTFFLLLALTSFATMAQTPAATTPAAQPAATIQAPVVQPTTPTVATPQSTLPVETQTTLAPSSPNYQPYDGTFGSNSTCETAAKPTGKTYNESINIVLASYPGYMIFDQHPTSCGKKTALVLVLISRDGSKPSRLHAIDTTKP